MRRTSSLPKLLAFTDIILVNFSLILATHLRSVVPFGVGGRLGIEAITPPWYVYVVVTLFWLGSLANSRAYEPQYILRWFMEAQAVFLSSLLCTGLLAGVLYFLQRDFSRLQFVYFILLTSAMLVGYRAALRLIYRALKIHRPGMRSRVLIVGAGELGKKIGQVLLSYSRWGFDLVGYLDDDAAKQGLLFNGVPVRGTVDQIRAVVEEKQIGEVWVTLPLRAYARLDMLVEALHDLAVKIFIVPDYSTHALVRSKPEVFAGMPVIGLRECAIPDGAQAAKRIFDLVVTTLFLVPLLPLMGLIALAIKLDSRGPVFFRQARIGENGAVFQMLKFRTMVVDAEAHQGEVNEVLEDGTIIHKHKDDPRVTRLGHVLRRFSLDELPQLFNVLKGEMSLVGPRPELPWLVEKYEPWQRKRFAVPQGISGWWQINDRSDKPMHLNTEDDLYYVYHYSLWLDVQILLRTPWAVLRGKGAF